MSVRFDWRTIRYWQSVFGKQGETRVAPRMPVSAGTDEPRTMNQFDSNPADAGIVLTGDIENARHQARVSTELACFTDLQLVEAYERPWSTAAGAMLRQELVLRGYIVDERSGERRTA